MSSSRPRQPSGDEPSVVVRNVGGRRVVSRSNPEISYAYGAPAVPGSNNRKRRTTSATPGPEDEAADASTSSVEQQQQQQEAQPDPKARYQALKRRKVQEEKEQKQREQEEEEQRRQQKVNRTPSKGGRASTARSPRKAKELDQVEQRAAETSLAPQQRMAVSSHGGSDDVSNGARQRMMSPGRSRSSLFHGQLNSFYMDRDASTEESASANGTRDEKDVPSSILLGAQRQGHDMLSGIGAAPELDSIHSSDIHDSRSRDYSALQREADMLADEGSSVSGSLRNAPTTQSSSDGLKSGFKGKGVANRTADKSAVKAGLNGIAEESDAELSATEGRKHSQRTTAVERKKAPASSQPAQSAPATVTKPTTAKPHQLPRPIARSSPRPRSLPWFLLALAGLTLATLYGLQQRGLSGLDLSPLTGNVTLSDQALRMRIHALEKRLQQAESQASLFDRQLGETRSAAERAADSVKNVPEEIASLRNKKDDVRKLDATLLQELKKTFVSKGEREDKPQSWESFRRVNEDALRKLTASIIAEDARKDTSTVDKSTMVALLQDELDKLKAAMEVRFNENVQGVQNDILAKVRAQQDMFERSGSWKKNVQAHQSQKAPSGAEKGSIEALIEEALDLYAADRIGERDFALYSAGGRIIPSLTSPTYGLRARTSPWLGWLSTSTAATSIERVGVQGQPPVIALVPDNTPGMCWAFSGSEGHLGISLARRVVVSKVTLEHTPASISHEAGTSAPRDVTVWGIVERPADVKRLASYRREQLLGHAAAAAEIDGHQEAGGDIAPTQAPPSDRHVLLASFTYDAFASRAVQTFTVSQEATQLQAPIAIVQVRVHSNHGKSDYTCLYRVRIHGREWTLDDEVASATSEEV